MDELKIGTCYEKKFVVGEEDTALALGSGGEKVLATPRLVAWMENTAFEGVGAHLKAEETTVGTLIELKHVAASPIGAPVTIKAILVSIEKRALVFSVEAWDPVEKVGMASHHRFLVDKKRFNEKVLKKVGVISREEV